MGFYQQFNIVVLYIMLLLSLATRGRKVQEGPFVLYLKLSLLAHHNL